MGRKVDVAKIFNISKAAEYLGIGQATVRAHVKRGLLATIDVEVPGSDRKVKVIEQATLDAYTAHAPGKAHGGAKAWIIRLTSEQHDEIAALLAERGLMLEARSTYDAEKARAYRLARKAEAAAELDDGDIEEDNDDTGTEGEDDSGDIRVSDETDGGAMQAGDLDEFQVDGDSRDVGSEG